MELSRAAGAEKLTRIYFMIFWKCLTWLLSGSFMLYDVYKILCGTKLEDVTILAIMMKYEKTVNKRYGRLASILMDH